MMKEIAFERDFCKELRQLALGYVIVLKNSSAFVQGIPDRQVIYRDKFVMLEFKRAKGSTQQANQARYIDLFNTHGLAMFVEPGNAVDAMNKVCSYLGLQNNSKYK